ncbi:tRNA N6-adenosine threonylcarbamoyltransferase, partial [termite gut metagenome]
SFLYSVREWVKNEPNFIEHHKADLAASLEAAVTDILMHKLSKEAKQYAIKEIAVAGGVSANTGLRNAFHEYADERDYGVGAHILREIGVTKMKLITNII